MAAWLDGVLFVPTLGGTTDWVVSAPVVGYQTLASANAVSGTKYKYHAQSADLTQWEDGEGTYTTGTLTRTTIIYSSNANAKVNFTVVPQVSVVALKEDMISIEEANSFTTTQQDQIRKNIGVFSGGGYANIVAAGSTNTINITADAVALYDGSGHIFGITSVSISISTVASGVNGLDTGTITTGQYFYFLIYNPTTGTVAALCSLSATAPTMPSGYTYKRRIGWINYNAGITPFTQRNAQFTWNSSRTIASGLVTTQTAVSLSGFCSPQASRVFGLMVVDNNNVTIADNVGNVIVQGSGIVGQSFIPWTFTPSNTTYQITYGSSSSGGSASVTGWEDNI